jgi:diaminopimelate decarboxylase
MVVCAVAAQVDQLSEAALDWEQSTSRCYMNPHESTSKQVLLGALTPSDCLSVTDDGQLAVEDVSATDLIAKFGSPLFVLSDSTLRQNVRRIRGAFEAHWPSTVNVMYAIKCNPNFAVRAVVHEEGAGGDCFGMGELEATFAGGADPDKIALNGSNKSDQVIARAIERGVTINMDAESEAEQVERVAASMDCTVRVNIRMKIVPQEYQHYKSDLMDFSGDFREELRRLKWGVNATTAERMIVDWKRFPHLELTGYHTHLGRLSQRVVDRADYDREFARVITAIFRKTGFAPTVIDLGGGWPRERDPESRTLERNRHAIEDYASATCEALLSEFKDAGMEPPALWLEPGRYIAGNAAVLLTTIESIKHEDGLTWYYVDASTNIMPMLGAAVEGTHNHVLSATRMHETLHTTADVVGPLCIPSVLRNDCSLPELAVGDAIVILDAGMYAESDSHQLNWIPRPATVMVRGTDIGLVRAAETLDSIFATQRLPNWLRGVNAPLSKYRDRAISEPQE